MNPSTEFRPAYFWFLNHDLELDEMKNQLLKMKNAGAGGVFLHARYGRITPYMEEKWLELHKDIIQYGAELGMKMYLYDEDSYPSGYAGGKTVYENPKEFSANFLVLHEELECESGETIEITLPKVDNYSDSEIYAIIANQVIETDVNYSLIHFPETSILIPFDKLSEKIQWTAPQSVAGDVKSWLISIITREWNPEVANLMSKDAITRFLELTHQKYYDYFDQNGMKKYFGTTIPAIFTDEPGIMYCKGDKSYRRIIPYTSGLEQKFEDQTNLKFLNILPAIFFDLEPYDPSFRLEFWRCASSLYSESYFKQIRDWCKSHSIELTGHLANEGNLFNQIRDQIDFFENAKYMGYGPMDQLGGVFRADFERNYNLNLVDNMVTPRLAGSVSRIYNKPRTLSECFGSTAWDMSLEIQKTLIDWQVSQGGVNLFTPHDYSYSIEGSRKKDHPPAFNVCSYFKEINVLNDYIGRLCYLFSLPRMKGPPRVGVIYGNTTILASMSPSMGQDAYNAHEALPYIVDLLQRQHVDFDILPESYIQNSNVGIGVIEDEFNAYDLIFVPVLKVLCASTYEKLKKFCDAGGWVIFIQKIPNWYWKGDSEMIKTELQHKLKYIENMLLIDAPFNPLYKNGLYNEIYNIIRQHHLLGHQILKEDGIPNGDLVIRRNDLQDQQGIILFMANVSGNMYIKQKIELHVDFKIIQKKFSLFSLDLETGLISKINSNNYLVSETRLIFSDNFKPQESKLFILIPLNSPLLNRSEITHTKVLAEGVDVIENFEEIKLKDWKLRPLSFNILNLNDWNLHYNVIQNGERASYLSSIYDHLFQIEIESFPSEIFLLIDSFGRISPNDFQIKINGQKITKISPGTHMDSKIYETQNIVENLHKGLNSITIRTTTKLASESILLGEPLRLMGDFQAIKKEKTGNWILKKQELVSLNSFDIFCDLRIKGYPNYIGPLEYSTNFELKEDDTSISINLSKENAPLCKIELNDSLMGYCWFGNYSIQKSSVSSGVQSLKIILYPYPTNLFESPGHLLGFQKSPKLFLRK